MHMASSGMIRLSISFFLICGLFQFAFAADPSAPVPAYIPQLRAALQQLAAYDNMGSRYNVGLRVDLGKNPQAGTLMVKDGLVINFDNATPFDWRFAMSTLAIYLRDGEKIAKAFGVPFPRPMYIGAVVGDPGTSYVPVPLEVVDPVTGEKTSVPGIVLSSGDIQLHMRRVMVHELSHVIVDCSEGRICELISHLTETYMGIKVPLREDMPDFLIDYYQDGKLNSAALNVDLRRMLAGERVEHEHTLARFLGQVLTDRAGGLGGALPKILADLNAARAAGEADGAARAFGFRGKEAFSELSRSLQQVFYKEMADIRAAGLDPVLALAIEEVKALRVVRDAASANSSGFPGSSVSTASMNLFPAFVAIRPAAAAPSFALPSALPRGSVADPAILFGAANNAAYVAAQQAALRQNPALPFISPQRPTVSPGAGFVPVMVPQPPARVIPRIGSK